MIVKNFIKKIFMKKLLIIFILFFVATNIYANTKIIHILVALCDNKYQGIVPTSRSLGNGQNPKTNLYWGAMYGVKSYLNKQKDWELLRLEKVDEIILERVIFKHKTKDIYIVADAYNGKNMKDALRDYFDYLAGLHIKNIDLQEKTDVDLVIFVGHNGLMDYSLSEVYKDRIFPSLKNKNSSKQTAVLGCQSQKYFSQILKSLYVKSAILTTGNMAPEGYVVHEVVNGFVNNLSNEEIRKNLGTTYSKYQKLKNPAIKLFVHE